MNPPSHAGGVAGGSRGVARSATPGTRTAAQSFLHPGGVLQRITRIAEPGKRTAAGAPYGILLSLLISSTGSASIVTPFPVTVVAFSSEL